MAGRVEQGLEAGAAANHPLANRMAFIAAASQNIAIGFLFGSFAVLLTTVEARLGVSRAMSSLAIPLISLGNACLAPSMGVLTARYSLRRLFLTGAILAVLGYLILATTRSYAAYLAAYTLFIGPSAVLCGSQLPATLVVRWFRHGRGKALGLVFVPVMVAIVPIPMVAIVARFGIEAAYTLMAAVVALVLVPLALKVVDHPPGEEPGTADTGQDADPAPAVVTAGAIVRTPRFWAICLTNSVLLAASSVIGTHVVAMAQSWRLDAATGAIMASVSALAGIPGSVAWGWVVDRIGGTRTLSLATLFAAVLWGLLLAAPGYPAVVVLIGVMGFGYTAAAPATSMALSALFGRGGFSRALGLSTLVTLPFTVTAIQGSSLVYGATGSYTFVFAILVVVCLAASPLAFLAGRGARTVAA